MGGVAAAVGTSDRPLAWSLQPPLGKTERLSAYSGPVLDTDDGLGGWSGRGRWDKREEPPEMHLNQRSLTPLVEKHHEQLAHDFPGLLPDAVFWIGQIDCRLHHQVAQCVFLQDLKGMSQRGLSCKSPNSIGTRNPLDCPLPDPAPRTKRVILAGRGECPRVRLPSIWKESSGRNETQRTEGQSLALRHWESSRGKREEWPNRELAFLRAVRGVCEACKSRGLRTLPFSKEAVGEEILELQEQAEKGLQQMLEQLLREDQSAGHVVGLLEIQNSTALQNLMVQLAVSLVDPNTGIQAQARETLGRLQRRLLFQWGLRKKINRPCWEANPGQPWKEGYLHLLQVGEVFWGRLTQTQKEAFLGAAWGNVSQLAQDWVREGSLILLYSLLGRAHKLLEEEEEEEDLRMSLSALL
uniref:Uncharacterized protein n=1 Tax=Sphaerodactylus townsendi TaxID=933632 RepID=A0ACB8FX45_9SAUR